MNKIITKAHAGAFWLLLPLFSLVMVSCSEEDDSVEEFPNWQENNEKFFNNLYAEATQRIAAGDHSWKLLPKWSLQDSLHLSASDYVIAHVKQEGTGTLSPIYSDTVFVHYQGHLLPSTTYASGFIFEQTWPKDYDMQTMMATKMGVSQTLVPVTSNSTTTYQYAANIDGFTTVLMHMHQGDRWEVYIPYQLGYGTEDHTGNSGTIPAYSTLVFDLTLASFKHAGE